MTTFLLGFSGALLGLGLVALGAFAGWEGRKSWDSLRRSAPRSRQDRKLKEEQQAFRQLQNYSAQQAYGMVDGEEDDR